MATEFRAIIELGNDAMRTGPEVAAALRDLASRLEDPEGLIDVGGIRDANGNTVGRWEVK